MEVLIYIQETHSKKNKQTNECFGKHFELQPPNHICSKAVSFHITLLTKAIQIVRGKKLLVILQIPCPYELPLLDVS